MADDNSNTPVRGVEIVECKHCAGTGECRVSKGWNNQPCSCEACVAKFGVKLSGISPVVPCCYCGGKGKHVFDLKLYNPSKPGKKGKQGNDNDKED